MKINLKHIKLLLAMTLLEQTNVSKASNEYEDAPLYDAASRCDILEMIALIRNGATIDDKTREITKTALNSERQRKRLLWPLMLLSPEDCTKSAEERHAKITRSFEGVLNGDSPLFQTYEDMKLWQTRSLKQSSKRALL